jgi:hypothetical protein
MKGIYLTEEGKQEIEAKIAQLNIMKREPDAYLTFIEYQKMIDLYKEILSSATILPVENSLNDIPISVLMAKQNLSEYYPNGVIIQSKQ